MTFSYIITDQRIKHGYFVSAEPIQTFSNIKANIVRIFVKQDIYREKAVRLQYQTEH